MSGQKGFSSVAMVGVLALIVVIGGVLFFLARSEDTTQTDQITPTQTAQMAEMSQSSDTPSEYQGTRLAGKNAPLLDFTKSDYDKALETDNLIVLYFYANWCPICRAEFPRMQEAFDELATDRVVGFRVNYNDNQTDSNEESLASQFGVAYQHTKVFVQNKEQVFKSPESWEKSRYPEEINRFIN